MRRGAGRVAGGQERGDLRGGRHDRRRGGPRFRLETLPEDFEGRQEIADDIVGRTMLGRGATLEDVGNAATFAASDQARAVTATAINITCGSVVD